MIERDRFAILDYPEVNYRKPYTVDQFGYI